MKYKPELALVRSQNVDITKFETQLDEFKTAFGRNWRLASEGFEEAVRRIECRPRGTANCCNFDSGLRICHAGYSPI